MARTDTPQIDVLVLGEHPATYLAAALLHVKSKLRVVHATIPGQRPPDRLVALNPDLFDLHPLLEPLRRRFESRAIYGVRFLGDDPAISSEYRNKGAVAETVCYNDISAAMQSLAEKQEVELLHPRQLRIHRLDETGVDVTLGNHDVRPKALILGGHLDEDQQRLLGLPDAWGEGVMGRYTFLKLKPARSADLGARPLMPMSLDLKGMLLWAWLMPGPRHMQLAVLQPVETLRQVPPPQLMQHWIDVLRRHGVFPPDTPIPADPLQSLDMPLAGALAHEGVANRTLLIGPAGGFYAASGEDIYPNCWSAVFAADAMKKALREPHLQDALQPYRQKWRTTLGEYLRGPQQNLRFLLPLVYRNQVMTSRLAEAILQGKSVVR